MSFSGDEVRELYIHFLHYCPHHRRHVYHNILAIVCSGHLQVVGMSNLPFILLHELSVISYILLISPLKVLHCLHQVLNWMSLDLINAFIHCAISPWGHLYMNFLVYINLMSSAAIFTSAHIAILLLSLHHIFFFFYKSSYCNLIIIII